MTNNLNTCPKCGAEKKSWYKLCFNCNEKEKQIPRCEVCGIEVQEGHTLCLPHYKEKQAEKSNLKKIDYVKDKKQEEFREKFEGKFYFNGQKVKSKSELLLLYFFEANDLLAQYETCLYLNDKEYRPDFVLEKGENTIIIEHFGKDDENYNKKRDAKIKEYLKLTKDNPNFFFIWTDENDIYNLKERLGRKLNETPLKRVRWK